MIIKIETLDKMDKYYRTTFLTFVIITLAACMSATAAASTISVGPGDMSVPAYVGGAAIATQTLKYGSGTGNFDPFLSIQSNRTDEGGYNTATGQNLDAIDGGTRTHLEILDDIPTVYVNGTKYREFVLDTNQSGQNPISVNQIEIFGGAAATDSPYPTGGATPTNYDVSPGLAMSPLFQLNNFPNGPPSIIEVQVPSVGFGSGHADMALYVPDADFAGILATGFVTLFTQMGTPPGQDPQSGGFEEWGVQQNSGGFGPGTAVPEPSTLVLLCIASTGLACISRRKVRG